MKETNKFKNDKLKVLDLLYRKFSLEASTDPAKSPQKITVPIYARDLKSYDITPEEFGEMVYLFTKNEDIEIVHGYDELQQITYRLESDEDISCFDIGLPNIFEEIHKKMVLELEGEETVATKLRGKESISVELPPGTKWGNITIRFIDNDNVEITAGDLICTRNYQEMGHEDRKQKRPDKQWQFLQLLSLQGGELSWDNNQKMSLKDIDAVKKKKQRLSDALKNCFGIKEDPFYSYRKEGAYRIKINLISEPTENKESDELGLEEAYKNQTPSVDDR